eukprot:scaffold21047_cov84-Skeletonema_dohrnii-CCMP3373.AAC.1
MDATLYDRAERMVKRSGMSLEVPPPVEEVEHVPATDQQNMAAGSDANSNAKITIMTMMHRCLLLLVEEIMNQSKRGERTTTIHQPR